MVGPIGAGVRSGVGCPRLVRCSVARSGVGWPRLVLGLEVVMVGHDCYSFWSDGMGERECCFFLAVRTNIVMDGLA